MKTQCSAMIGWRAILLLASLMVLGHVAYAQQPRPVRTIQGGIGGGAGAGFQFVHRIDGSGPARGVRMVINGQDIGPSLLDVCDTNQNGAATVDEVKTALLNWFRQADTDTNGALDEIELSAALQSLFPSLQPPPGAPELPEDQAFHNLLAKKLMAAIDANNDTWITSNEAIALVDQNYLKWDVDSSGALDTSEFAAAFAQFMPAPSFNSRVGGTQGPGFSTRFDR
jgi:hypothetical protein